MLAKAVNKSLFTLLYAMSNAYIVNYSIHSKKPHATRFLLTLLVSLGGSLLVSLMLNYTHSLFTTHDVIIYALGYALAQVIPLFYTFQVLLNIVDATSKANGLVSLIEHKSDNMTLVGYALLVILYSKGGGVAYHFFTSGQHSLGPEYAILSVLALVSGYLSDAGLWNTHVKEFYVISLTLLISNRLFQLYWLNGPGNKPSKPDEKKPKSPKPEVKKHDVKKRAQTEEPTLRPAHIAEPTIKAKRAQTEQKEEIVQKEEDPIPRRRTRASKQ